jgi:hypothetical protein
MDFLIPLMNTLAIGAAILTLLFALFSAPWQILLLILITGLWGTQRLMQDNLRRSLREDQSALQFSQFHNKR